MPRSIRSAAPALLAAVVLAGCAGNAPRGGDDAAMVATAKRFAPVFEHMENADFLRAESELQRLAKATPDDAQIHVNLGIVYANTERLDEAVTALETATELAPESPTAFNELGIAYRKTGEFAKAAAAYREALRLHPDYANAHYNLGVLLDIYLRQPSVALGHYEKYLNLAGDDDKQVQAWVKDLKRRTASGPTTASNDEEVERR